MDWRLLGEEQVGSIERQVAVDLVGRNLVVADVAEGAAGVHHHARADDVGLQEDAGILNAAIHMALRSKVDHHVGLLLLEEIEHALPVTDIQLQKSEVRRVHDGRERGQIPCVGEFVDAHHTIFRVPFQVIEDKVGADKPSPAGDNYGHSDTALSFSGNHEDEISREDESLISMEVKSSNS